MFRKLSHMFQSAFSRANYVKGKDLAGNFLGQRGSGARRQCTILSISFSRRTGKCPIHVLKKGFGDPYNLINNWKYPDLFSDCIQLKLIRHRLYHPYQESNRYISHNTSTPRVFHNDSG